MEIRCASRRRPAMVAAVRTEQATGYLLIGFALRLATAQQH